ncbi:MAG: amino acid adenylation domain protein [Firmicutes bacterium]|nr:amino acid adenylation domain protein [Bacillota bacterium]
MLLDKHSQNIVVASGEYQEEKEYWLGKLSGEIYFHGFPGDKDQQGYTKAIFKRTLPSEVFNKILHLGNGSEYAAYVILLSGIKYLLCRYNDSGDVIVGMPVFKQALDDLYLNSMLPIRSSIDREETFSDFIMKITDSMMEADSYQNYPLDKIYEQLHLCSDSEADYKTVVLLENIHEKKMIRDLEIDTVFSFLLTKESIELVVEYNANIYTEQIIKQVVKYLFNYLREVTQNPQIKLSDIEILSEAEKQEILIDFNNTDADYPKNQTIYEVFEAQVKKSPNNMAVVFGNQRLTYQELNNKANQLARVLRSKGVQANSIVGIMVERSLEMIIGIMGIVKAGGAYLPIAPDYPAERINYMLDDSGTQILLTQNRFLSEVPFTGLMVDLEDAGLYSGDCSNLEIENNSRNLAYVIYTSGSTGKPKGAMIEHYSVINRINWMQKCYPLTEEDVILQKTPFTFDVSVWEIFWWSFIGASVCMLKPGGEKEPEEIVAAIEKDRITTMHFVPSMLTVFLNYIDNRINFDSIASLKQVFASGEALNPEHANTFNKLFAGYDAKLINLYGPTEATVDVSYFNCSTGKELQIVPIGKPIDNIKLYIINKNNKLQPVGMVGELCIAGDGLARGYLNKPELTAEKFVQNPFMSGEKMYRTGDLARWLPDGNIEFLGRMDHQVKIRGFRIELGEIETELLKHPSIKETIVVARDGNDGDKYLCAYIVAEREVTIAELREHLSRTLPDYMLPPYFVELEKMPLNSNGKADRKALPEPKGNINTGVNYVAPRDETEEILVEVWQTVLKAERVGIKDNFFSLGGDSIKAIQVLARLSQKGLTLEMRDLFKHPIIEELSGYVTIANKKISQEIVKGEVIFSPMQSWLFEQNFADKHHFNQAVMLYGKHGFEESIIEKVFSKIVEHHDVLRTVIMDGEGEPVQFNRGLEEKAYTIETVNLIDNDNYVEIIEKEAERIQKSINLTTGPLAKLGLFKTKAGDHLLIVIHHLVVDGVSWRIILQDLFSGYIQAQNNEEIKFADKTHSFQEWTNGLVDYANSREVLSEIEYWLGLENTSVKSLPKDKTVMRRFSEDNEHVQLKMTKEETDKLLTKVNSAYNTEVNDILLAALGLTVNDWAGQDKVLINLEGHGREEIIKGIDISRTVGWFTAQYPVMLDMSGERDLAYRIKSVKESMRRIPNKGIGYGILKYLTSPEHKKGLRFTVKPEISFNYLGQFDEDMSTELFTMSDMSAGKFVSPRMESLYALDINGIVSNGRLTLNFTYHGGEYERKNIIKFAEMFRQELIMIINHCAACDSTEMTPSDFTLNDITLEELETFMDTYSDVE